MEVVRGGRCLEICGVGVPRGWGAVVLVLLVYFLCLEGGFLCKTGGVLREVLRA